MKQPRFNRKFVIGTVAVLCVISVAAGAAAYPRIFNIVGIRKQLINSERDFQLCREAALAVETFRTAEGPIVNTLLKEFEAKLPAAEQIPELIREVKRAGRAAGIEGLSIVTGPPETMELCDERLAASEEGRLHRIRVDLSGAATYRGLAALLDELASGRRLVLAERLSIRKHQRVPSLVEFRIEAEAFCFLPVDEDDVY